MLANAAPRREKVPKRRRNLTLGGGTGNSQMILSMTGFAAEATELPGLSLSVELRSVNHRYLDVTVKLPDELRQLEPALRERLAGDLKRGKVECRVGISRTSPGAANLAVDAARVAQLAAAAARSAARRAGRRAAVGQRNPALARRPGRAVGSARKSSPRRSSALVDQAVARPDGVAPARRRQGARRARGLLRRHRGAGCARDAAHPGHPRGVQREACAAAEGSGARPERGSAEAGVRGVRHPDRRRRGIVAARHPRGRSAAGARTPAAAPASAWISSRRSCTARRTRWAASRSMPKSRRRRWSSRC